MRASHARRGAGARLMDRAESDIAAAGFAAAMLETDTFNQRSQSFYAARGYQEGRRYPDTEWNSDLTTILPGSPRAPASRRRPMRTIPDDRDPFHCADEVSCSCRSSTSG